MDNVVALLALIAGIVALPYLVWTLIDPRRF